MPQDDDVIAALFDRIATKGLGKARLSDLSRQLKIPFAEFYRHYPSVESILHKFIDQIDQTMIQDVKNSAAGKRDLYFDMLMSRMDSLQRYRPGVTRWLQDLAKQPELWPGTLQRWKQSLALMLDVAQDSPLFPVKKLGLAVVYGVTLRAWMRDDSSDLAKTMAAADQALQKADRFTERFLTPKKAA